MPIGAMRGITVPHKKKTQHSSARRIPVPARVTIPMVMHIGVPAKPVVKAGDMVQVGQMIAEGGGVVSAPIHTGVAGQVKSIGDFLLASGQIVQAITIETQGEQVLWEGLTPPIVTNRDEFLAAVQDSGVVGLGGAGFPTRVKLAVPEAVKIDAVIINGAECEPYITSDTRTMVEDTDLVWAGIGLLQTYLRPEQVIIGIEDNKPQCLQTFRDLCGQGGSVAVKALPARYPQGGEKVLVYQATGRIVPEGKLPLDVGVLVINCTTLAAIARYIQTGMPLVEKCVTVDGSAIKEPQNVLAPIGTPLQDIFDFCGGFAEEPRKILYGGPMMGIAVTDRQAPVLKNTNAVLALGAKEAMPPEETACIKCGRCIDHCPLNLMPCEMEMAYRRKDAAMLEKLKLPLCMECGCCAYVCPARRPLVQVHKLSKAMLRVYQAAR